MSDLVYPFLALVLLAVTMSVTIRLTILFLRISGISDLLAELHDRRRENRR